MARRVAAYTSWANTVDPTKRTAPGRTAALARFERQVDPDGTMPAPERARRAEAAKKAYFLNLARLSAQARRRRKDGKAAAS